jgi:hypothetical protein
MADLRLDIPVHDSIPGDLEAFVNERLGLGGMLQLDATARAPGADTIFVFTAAPVIVGFFARFGENAADRLREVFAALRTRVRPPAGENGPRPVELVVEGPGLWRVVVDEDVLADRRALPALRRLVEAGQDDTLVLRWRPDARAWELDPTTG